MRSLKRLLPLVALALILGACTSTTQAIGEGASVVEISGRMPPLSGNTLRGTAFGASDYRGRPVVVNFWATWCGPCRREQPALAAAARQAGSNGPVFVGVNFWDDEAAARAYLRQFDVGYPSLQDASGALAYRFGVPYLPATIFVDANGQMRYRTVGALDPTLLARLIAKISG